MFVEELNINVIADNRQELIKYLMSYLLNNPSPLNYHEYLFAIERIDCGCEVRYKTFDEIPCKNVICKHGNKMIVYAQLN